MESELVKLGKSGRIVIPRKFRQSLGIKEGDELIVLLEGEELKLFTRRQGIKRAQAIVRQYIPEGHSLSEELIKERRAEAARE